MNNEDNKRTLAVHVDERTFEQIQYLAEQAGMSVIEMANKLLADEAEAQAGLERGPFLRRHMYRA